MSNAFRKSVEHAYSPSSGVPATAHVFKPVQVVSDGCTEPVTVVEEKEVLVEDLAQSLGLPSSDDYRLDVMLRNGLYPQEVNVHGMLDSSDPLDPSNVGAGATLFDRLQNIVEARKATEPAPAEPTPVEPAPAES